MCSIAAIPSELRVLGHSPPVCGSLLYSSLMVTTPPAPIVSRNTVPPQIRSCLASASLQLNELIKNSSEDASSSSSSSSVADSNKRNKKRVVFADDRGRPLEHVRVIGESSSTPPSWTSSYVASLVRGGLFQPYDELEHRALTAEPEPLERKAGYLQEARAVWDLCFAQPASDYMGFRDKLDRQAVSLENVLVNEAEQSLVGTVKVKNLAYVKEVTLRLSFDQWTSHRDVACSYVQQQGFGQSSSVRSLYDTFRFRVELAHKSNASRQLDFCIRYRTDGRDYWDNNDGANYCVKKKRDVSLEEQITELLSSCCGPTSVHNGFDQTHNREQLSQKLDTIEDATRCQIRDWSEFASWQHLDNDSPYW